MTHLYIGTSGYTYKDWRDIFYPKGVAQKNWLTFYAQHYNAVEINATFYRPFPEHVFTHWHDSTPEEFRFVLKAPKLITHEKALVDIEQDLEQFVSSIGALKEKLAAVLWQFPASARKEVLQVPFQQLLTLLPGNIKHVFEFRSSSWFNEEIYALLNRFDAGFVINDSPHFPSQHVNTDHLLYVRLHGPGALYTSTYSAEQLLAWSEEIAPHLGHEDIYLFFNNTSGGHALGNANDLRLLLKPNSP
ncbi:MAG: DUF72 domain-containing protein [Chloroflexota bacterium]